MSENWEISIFRKNSNYLIHLKNTSSEIWRVIWRITEKVLVLISISKMFRVIQVEGFNICLKVKPGNKNIFIDLQPTKLTIFITFHTTTLSLSLTYLSTQISFGKPFWWGSTELGYWKEGEIHMFERAPVKLLALPFVSSLFSIKRVRIVFQNTSTLTLPDFALLIFDLLCNQLVGNKCIHL